MCKGVKTNINNLYNDSKVSKIIRATIDEQKEFVKFENALNEIDKDGIYHIKMLGYRIIRKQNINCIQNINNNSREEMKIMFNFKITYQFGGISIKDFLEKFIDYQTLVNEYFLQRLLRGILNCLKGLYIFYRHGFVHKDLNSGNIVFFIDQPEIMRLIDWGILLPNGNSNNNSNANSAHNSGNNLQNSIDKKMILSLSRYYNINNLISKVKVWIENKKYYRKFFETTKF